MFPPALTHECTHTPHTLFMHGHTSYTHLSEKDEVKVRSDEHLFSEMPETPHENDLYASDNGLSSLGRYQLAS